MTYAELAGVRTRPHRRLSYVIRNALVPQLTALAMALGGIFSGTIITEQVFTYPGLGSLLVTRGQRRRHDAGAGRLLHRRSSRWPARSSSSICCIRCSIRACRAE